MNKHEVVIIALNEGRDAKMRVFGNSMVPLIKPKSVVTYRCTNDYEVGDVVLVKFKGNYLTHKITKIDGNGRFMIANNKGRENGWVSSVFGRVIEVNGESFGRPAKGITMADIDARASALYKKLGIEFDEDSYSSKDMS